MSEEWRRHLLETPDDISALLQRVHSVAVLGIKIASQPAQPAYYVPEYAQQAGMRIIPVPVYFPDVTEILGERVYRRVADIPGDVDLVNVFRQAHRIPEHVDDILAKKPTAAWFQLGIRNDAAAERLARAGIDVVQDLCLLVELRERGR
ncbi:MAG TPA: CoA-binding protein [Gemmatimonadaceae bacterium]|nr:CoA-binding protein [Gemmatimonadaceae bacterium]